MVNDNTSAIATPTTQHLLLAKERCSKGQGVAALLSSPSLPYNESSLLVSMSSEFQLSDPVHITRSGEARPLEGVVAYIGKVDFDTSNSDDPYVGVRLTGTSVGLGKNNGTVQGKTYFTCPTNCGSFVRQSNLQKRTLTKLEELKLKRELAKSGGGTGGSTTPPRTTSSGGTSTAKRTPPRTSASPSPAATPSTTTTTAPSTTSTSARPAANKLEELRRRREALQAKKQQQKREQEEAPAATTTTAATPSTSSVTAASPPSTRAPTPTTTSASTSPAVDTDALVKEAEERVKAEFQTQLDRQREQNQSLQQQVQNMTTDLQTAQSKVKTLESEKAQLQVQVQQQQASSASDSAALHLQQQLQAQVSQLQEELSESKTRVASLQSELTTTQSSLQNRDKDFETLQAKHDTMTGQLKTLQDELAAKSHQNDSTALLYKERAALQVQLSGQTRKLEQLQTELTNCETTIEDLALDKEQLEQEKEDLQERLEIALLNADSASVQVEELKLELEDARASLEDQQARMGGDSIGAPGVSGDDEDVAQALQIQNGRLREALIRLREQAALEKLEGQRQLREAEKDAEVGRSLSKEVEELRVDKKNLLEQIEDLKDMVEQGSAFEQMVEDLSDRIMAMEDDNVQLRQTIRELEEAMELSAEMEEVQTEEVKALTRDLEERDTIVLNLEEAIKMQRRREEDFLRTVTNYRTTVATLKQEKQALLELQQGGEGEKSDLIAASQNALTRAAQLVSDAAAMRKREARAVMDKINKQIYRHLSYRLESLLPQSVTAAEVSAIKGELTASKVVGMASTILEGISISYSKAIRPPLDVDETAQMSDLGPIVMPDEIRQKVATMTYQADFSRVIIGVSSDLLRFLAAGQWPDLLSQESSCELGSILGHATESLDSTLAQVLKTLKEEGALTAEQSNIGALQQTIHATMYRLRSDVEREEETLLPASWNPPGWQLMKDVADAKFSAQGAAAALSSVLNQSDDFVPPPALALLYSRVEQLATQSKAASLRLANLDVKDENLVKTLSDVAAEWREKASDMLDCVKTGLLEGNGLEASGAAVDEAARPLTKLSSALRTAHLNPNEDESYHALSPEVSDTWTHVTALAKSIRAVDGDAEDVHYLLRAHYIEAQLGDAVDKVPRLEEAKAKNASLEKVSKVFLLATLEFSRPVSHFISDLIAESRLESQGSFHAVRPIIRARETSCKDEHIGYGKTTTSLGAQVLGRVPEIAGREPSGK